MTPTVLAELVRDTAIAVLDDHGLDAGAVPDVVTVRRAPAEHGDYATNLALRVGGLVGVAPVDIARWLADAVRRQRGIAAAEVAGPGFVNMRLTPDARGEVVRDLLVETHWEPLALTAPAPELVAAIGMDAVRYLAARSPESTVDTERTLEALDPARWRGRGDDNPVYYAQYAYARLSSLLRNARDLALTVPGPETPGLDLGLLTHPREGGLVGTLGEFPRVVATGEPHQVARCLDELATASYGFTDHCRVLPQGDAEPTPLTTARLALCAATRHALGAGLRLIGVTAPERM